MKVGYMTGVLMGEAQADAEQNVSYKPKETFAEENQGGQSDLKDDVKESNTDENSDGGSYSFLNTNMIIYIVLGLALFKAFKK
jgi:hypothetical protein